ncbi:MAG: peptidase dimerization domain-containing protein [Gemmatimonadaceae bacterium]|jgi:aminobenzoyl-glutamate utilization protein B|nr:peptidase dimerization domain-containing protein [Gemmatimonadaceae bacterium]
MSLPLRPSWTLLLAALLGGAATASAQRPDARRLDRLKAEAATLVDARATLAQQMVDQVFSFGELGMQETETSAYLTAILEREGFTVERGVAGIPTAWTAKWGSGKPVIAMGSDIDGIPQSSQKPGVAGRGAIVPGAPGHGEGHNSGVPLNIVAALALKDIMQREKLSGTLLLWPGTAEEQLASKAFLVRAGMFKDVDANIFTHVADSFGASWGDESALALISALFKFRGEAAHAAGAPWRGKSALDAVIAMANLWEAHREHMELAQRSHYVITDGGDQPNVVPGTGAIWFFFRERNAELVTRMFEDAKQIARAAAQGTFTVLDTVQVIGSAWRPHFNRPMAEAMHANMVRVGMPKWDDKDIAMAQGVQRLMGQPPNGLKTEVPPLRTSQQAALASTGTGSDDIGDVTWTVPSVTLYYPSNIPGTPGHNAIDGIAMATPIAHKGVVAGAKVQAMTVLDLLLSPTLVADAKTYFTDVQTKNVKYKPLISATDQPAIWLNAEKMARYRPLMRPFYFDPTKYKTYLEQLGIAYPTIPSVP